MLTSFNLAALPAGWMVFLCYFMCLASLTCYVWVKQNLNFNGSIGMIGMIVNSLLTHATLSCELFSNEIKPHLSRFLNACYFLGKMARHNAIPHFHTESSIHHQSQGKPPGAKVKYYLICLVCVLYPHALFHYLSLQCEWELNNGFNKLDKISRSTSTTVAKTYRKRQKPGFVWNAWLSLVLWFLVRFEKDINTYNIALDLKWRSSESWERKALNNCYIVLCYIKILTG